MLTNDMLPTQLNDLKLIMNTSNASARLRWPAGDMLPVLMKNMLRIVSMIMNSI